MFDYLGCAKKPGREEAEKHPVNGPGRYATNSLGSSYTPVVLLVVFVCAVRLLCSFVVVLVVYVVVCSSM